MDTTGMRVRLLTSAATGCERLMRALEYPSKSFRLLAQTPLTCPNELDQVLNLRQRRQFGFNLRDGVRDRQSFAEKQLVGLLERGLGGFSYAVALEAHFVDGAGLRWIAVGDHERRHVLHHFRASADHRKRANAAKLVNRRQPANDRVVPDDDVAGQGGDVGHDDVVAELNVVRDVAVCQNVIVRADPRDAAVARGAVNRDVLSEGVAIANLRARHAAAPLQVLSLQPDAGERESLVLSAKRRVPLD